MREITIQLPYPSGVSVNSVWRKANNRIYLNPKVIKYRNAVYIATRNIQTFDDEIEVFIKMYPPDKRIRDIDNILKSIFDALKHAEVINSDYQIRKATIERLAPIRDGLIELMIQSTV